MALHILHHTQNRPPYAFFSQTFTISTPSVCCARILFSHAFMLNVRSYKLNAQCTTIEPERGLFNLQSIRCQCEALKAGFETATCRNIVVISIFAYPNMDSYSFISRVTVAQVAIPRTRSPKPGGIRFYS